MAPITPQYEIVPLATTLVPSTARPTFPVHGEMLYTNEELILAQTYPSGLPIARYDDGTPIQQFPGQLAPVVIGNARYPMPEVVGGYTTESEFRALRKYPAQWVHWQTRSELVLEGRYHEVTPVHYEGIFTLVCNFMCPHCSRRPTRTQWVSGGTWANNSLVTSDNTMTMDHLILTIDRMSRMKTDDQMGIVWGGGDPTATPWVYEAMEHAKTRGVKASFLTNGVLMEPARLLEIEPILVRVSLNCGTEDQYARFHGYPKAWGYFDQCLEHIREMARLKVKYRPKTLFGISLIVDERNMDDMIAAAGIVRDVVADAGRGSIDYCIVRPVYDYKHFTAQGDLKSGGAIRLAETTRSRAQDQFDASGEVRRIIESVGVPLVLVKDSFDAPPDDGFYEEFTTTDCLSYGWCGEIRHNGDVQLCSDSYGNPLYTIGNVWHDELGTIWSSERRQRVLDEVNARQCFKTHCPHNSRGHHLNRIFHQIESFRAQGRMDEVRQWVDDLRAATLPLGHSFFI